MYETKTKPTKVSASTYFAGIENDERRRDCKTLAALMKRITGCPPRMWGPSIVGFDRYHYKYATGHEGDCCLVGFSSGKSHLSIHLIPGYEAPATKALLALLGPHRTGKGCLYIKRLSDVKLPVLEKLIVQSIAETHRRYPSRKN